MNLFLLPRRAPPRSFWHLHWAPIPWDVQKNLSFFFAWRTVLLPYKYLYIYIYTSSRLINFNSWLYTVCYTCMYTFIRKNMGLWYGSPKNLKHVSNIHKNQVAHQGDKGHQRKSMTHLGYHSFKSNMQTSNCHLHCEKVLRGEPMNSNHYLFSNLNE